MNEIKDDGLIKKIRKITLLVCDVDGVLTDGRIIMDNRGNELKHFDVRDGHGLKLIMRYGIGVALLTGAQIRGGDPSRRGSWNYGGLSGNQKQGRLHGGVYTEKQLQG